MIYQVECDTGCRYSQEVERKTQRPIICGICGRPDIRVWELVYDAMTLVVKRRIELREKVFSALNNAKDNDSEFDVRTEVPWDVACDLIMFAQEFECELPETLMPLIAEWQKQEVAIVVDRPSYNRHGERKSGGR